MILAHCNTVEDIKTYRALRFVSRAFNTLAFEARQAAAQDILDGWPAHIFDCNTLSRQFGWTTYQWLVHVRPLVTSRLDAMALLQWLIAQVDNQLASGAPLANSFVLSPYTLQYRRFTTRAFMSVLSMIDSLHYPRLASRARIVSFIAARSELEILQLRLLAHLLASGLHFVIYQAPYSAYHAPVIIRDMQASELCLLVSGFSAAFRFLMGQRPRFWVGDHVARGLFEALSQPSFALSGAQRLRLDMSGRDPCHCETYIKPPNAPLGNCVGCTRKHIQHENVMLAHMSYWRALTTEELQQAAEAGRYDMILDGRARKMLLATNPVGRYADVRAILSAIETAEQRVAAAVAVAAAIAPTAGGNV